MSRKWPIDVDPTSGKRIGVVTSWNKDKGTILALNFDLTNIHLYVTVSSTKNNSVLIVGEEVEFNIADIDTKFPFAVNVSGPRDTCLQYDKRLGCTLL